MPSTIAVESQSGPLPMEMSVQSSMEAEEQQVTENIVSLGKNNEDLERKFFMEELNKFMSEIGKPLSKIPIMGYKELDLYQLFKEVTAYGGFNEVVKNVGTWSKIWKRLGNFDPSITDSSFRLKKNYERYLLEFEYKAFPEHRKQALELEKHIQMKKSYNRGGGSDKHSYGAPPSPNNSDSSSTPSSPIFAVCVPKTREVRKRHMKEKRKSSNHSPSAGGLFSLKDVVRDKNGQPKMPLVLGDLTIECLGTIIPRPAYITEKRVWPVGFVSQRHFASMLNPEKRVQYTSQIIDGGDKPQFVVMAADEPMNPIISHSPSACWQIVLQRVMMSKTGVAGSADVSVNGNLRFGLAHPTVSHLVRELPNADKCEQISSLSLLSSPEKRKRNFSDFSDDNSSCEDDEEQQQLEDGENLIMDSNHQNKKIKATSITTIQHYAQGFHREFCFSARDVVLTSREEIDDLENAVATLQALKYCAIY